MARPGIEPLTSDLRVRCPTNCATRPSWLVVLGLTALSVSISVYIGPSPRQRASSAGASYNLDYIGQGPTVLAVGVGGGCLDIFTLIYPFFPLSFSLWETARYRLKYCLKGPLIPKQPTNQPREREKEKRNDRREKKNVQTTPTRTYCKCTSPSPTPIQVSRTPRH